MTTQREMSADERERAALLEWKRQIELRLLRLEAAVEALLGREHEELPE